MRRILAPRRSRGLPRVAAGDPYRVQLFAAGGRQTSEFDPHVAACPFCIGHGLLVLHACEQTRMPGDGMLNIWQLPDVHCELSVHGS